MKNRIHTAELSPELKLFMEQVKSDLQALNAKQAEQEAASARRELELANQRISDMDGTCVRIPNCTGASRNTYVCDRPMPLPASHQPSSPLYIRSPLDILITGKLDTLKREVVDGMKDHARDLQERESQFQRTRDMDEREKQRMREAADAKMVMAQMSQEHESHIGCPSRPTKPHRHCVRVQLKPKNP